MTSIVVSIPKRICRFNSDLCTKVKQTIENPNIFALALRYVSLAESSLNLIQLEEYLNSKQNSVIRGTAAALLLTRGTTKQKVAATKTLRWMLTNKDEEIRVDGVNSLAEAAYLQALRIHIPSLLEDESLRVK